MRFSWLIIIFMLFIVPVKSQNMVSNWDFSQPCGCGLTSTSLGSGVQFFKDWTFHVASNGIWNSKRAGITSFSPPNAFYRPGINGCPLPFHGNGYMAMPITVYPQYLQMVSNQSELPLHRNTLLETLNKDTTYCVEMQVRAFNGILTGYYSCETHDKLGVYFTDQDSLPTPFPWQDGIVPQVWNNTGYIDNLNDWRQVKGSFVANGGEQYLYIGNFDPFSSPPYQHTVRTVPSEICNTAGIGYIFVDAIMVYNCRDTVFEVQLKDTTVCYGERVALLPVLNGFKLEDTVTTYTWQTPMGSFAQTDSSFLATQPGTYTVEVEINKRFKATQTIVVHWLDPKPDTAMLPATVQKCLNKETMLTIPQMDSVHYLWNTGSADTALRVLHPGYYEVTLNHPCWQYTTGTYVEDENCETLFVPNAFSPNSDGVNDYFVIRGLNNYLGTPLKLIISDRWGKIVFKSNDYQNNWDGTFNGVLLPQDVYTYRLFYYPGELGWEALKEGTITIIH